MIKKNLIYLLLAVFLLAPTALTSCRDNDLDDVEMTGFDMDDSEINKLIDEDQKLIAQQGYGNLVIPRRINKMDKSKMPSDALWVCHQLDSAGYKAYLVGGAIRDLIMGLDPDDYDVTTSASLDQMKAVFGDKLHTHVSGSNTYAGVIVKEGNQSIDLASYQECPKSYIEKGFVSQSLVTNSLLGDSFERDLPFNALYYEPSTGDLIDYHGGIADIRDKKIHAMVSDPDVELVANVTIIPRVLRFQAKYEYTLDSKFDKALKDSASVYIQRYPVNILMGNLSKMFFDGYGVRCYNNMVNYGIFDYCFPILKELPSSEDYNTWIVTQLTDLDTREKGGEKVSYGYPIALITYPVYKNLRWSMTADEAAQHIFDVQTPVMDIWDSNKTEMKRVYEEFYSKEAQMTGFDINDSAVKSLIEADQQVIASQGYGNLIIPREVNKIPRSAFSDDAIWVCQQLYNAGFDAYIVGGCIRDMAMGKTGDDFDVTTNASLEEQKKIFGDKLHTHEVGEFTFGMVAVTDGNDMIDLAGFQDCPSYYIEQGIIAKETVSKNLLGDSFQRDLPFNAIYYQPSTGNIIDYHGGLADILNKTINSMVDPDIEFTINCRVIPRALRFQAKYQYSFSAALEKCLLSNGAKYMAKHPANALMYNVGKMFDGGYGERCYENLMKYNIFDLCFPAAKEIMNQDSYKSYVTEQLNAIDAKVNGGTSVEATYPVAVILYPVYKDLRATMTHDAAASQIIKTQQKVMDLTDAEQTAIKQALSSLYSSATKVLLKTRRYKRAA